MCLRLLKRGVPLLLASPRPPWRAANALSASFWHRSLCSRCACACRRSTEEPGASPTLMALPFDDQNARAGPKLTRSQSLPARFRRFSAKATREASALPPVPSALRLPPRLSGGELDWGVNLTPTRANRIKEARACIAPAMQCS